MQCLEGSVAVSIGGKCHVLSRGIPFSGHALHLRLESAAPCERLTRRVDAPPGVA